MPSAGATGAVPLRLKLWNGRRIDLSAAPTGTVVIPNMSALRYFISPDLNKLGEAFVEGHIRVEGSIHEIFGVAESLARNFAVHTRSGLRRVTRQPRFARVRVRAAQANRPRAEEWLLIEWPKDEATHSLLPLHFGCRHLAQGSGGHGQNALAYRT